MFSGRETRTSAPEGSAEANQPMAPMDFLVLLGVCTSDRACQPPQEHRRDRAPKAVLVRMPVMVGCRGLSSVGVVKGLSSMTPGMAPECGQQSGERSPGLVLKSTCVQSPSSKLCDNAPGPPEWRAESAPRPRY